jgi:uncharacterized protein YndB with AHSA1/START domain
MTQHPRSTHHDSFTIERTYAATPHRVFDAWANPAAKRKWFTNPDAWTSAPHRLDFKVGGRESVAGGPAGGQLFRYEAVYHDIVPDQRIVSTYDMYMDEARISVSLVSVTFAPAGDGTRLVYTEQVVFLDGLDHVAAREQGTHGLLDKLGASLGG